MKEIKLEDNNGGIRLRFQVAGKRFVFSPIRGARFANDWDRKRAEAIANTIQADISTGHFDPTLEKYKLQSGVEIQKGLAKVAKELAEAEAQRRPLPDLRDLWGQYRAFKAKTLAPSTIAIDFDRRVGNTLPQLPTTDLRGVVEIRDWLLENKTPEQTKKIITQLSACCDWAQESGLIPANPFSGMAKRVRVTKKDDDDDINPFTAEERDRVCEAFSRTRYYRHYFNLVRFLFFTGCRPNEALALTWEDDKGSKLIFNKGFVAGVTKKGLKTQRQRKLTVNAQVREILDSQRDYLRKAGYHSPLIFPSAEGMEIDWGNFTNRAWRRILESLEGIEYRNPYQCRHTFITLAIKAGVSYPDLAKHCGNSPEMILKKYQGVSRGFVMPSL